jgi:SAM-dependent methyltransferase
MTGFMNPAEFAHIAASERDFWWYRGMRTILFRVLEPYLVGRHIGRALDAGCGTGYQALLLQKERGWTVAAVDISGDGLRYARAMGVERPVQGDSCRLPFRNGCFELVLSMDMLPHLKPGMELAAAAEMIRVLAPGGLLALRAPAFDILRSRHSDFISEYQRFTRRRLTHLFSRAGLRILRCTYANSLLMPIALAKFRLWEPLLRKPAASGVESVPPWLNRALNNALQMEAAWLGCGLNFPAGQSLILVGERA